MKPNFALSLSFDGLRLMHRVEGGWHLVGQVALDDPDLGGALSRLRIAATDLDPAPMATKLLIPNDQIRYIALDTTRAQEHDVVEALDGATPYPVADLVYHYAKGGGRTYVAAVARETLAEARAFANEYGFNPVSFAAVPEPFTYVGEAFFGSVEGVDVEQDQDAVVVIGEAHVVIQHPDPDVAPAPTPPAPTPPVAPPPAAPPVVAQAEDVVVEDPLTQEGDVAEDMTGDVVDDNLGGALAQDLQLEAEPETPAEPKNATGEDNVTAEDNVDTTEIDEVIPEDAAAAASDAVQDTPDDHEPVEPSSDDPVFAPEDNTPVAPLHDVPARGEQQDIDAPDETPIETPVDTPVDTPDEIPGESPDAISDEVQDETPDEVLAPEVQAPEVQAPIFGSLRADRNEGRPVASAETTGADNATDGPKGRADPTFGRQSPPALAVPTGKGTDPMPPVTAPSRDDIGAASVSLSADVPDPDTAPAVTGDAPTARPAEDALATAPLIADPVVEEQDAPVLDEPETSDTVAAAVDSSVASAAAGGMFASRRMARADAKAKKTDKPNAKSPRSKSGPKDKSRKTVFGARKQPKPKTPVGGKPKFLGLILTAVLLLFLLAMAAFAALADDTIARWLGLDRGTDTQIAEAPAPDVTTPVIAPTPTEVATAPDALATPTAATGAQILTPEDAQRIYAATGVWQRAPRIPQTPRSTSLDGLQFAAASQPVVRVPSSPLLDASDIAGDAVIAPPVDPPPPSATFNYGTDGLVIATPEGAPTPDGVLIIAGTPPLNPPTRPGTVAPEITPQDQLAALAPEQATVVPDAPAGVIVISGSPTLTPPVRTGTVAPTPNAQPQVIEQVTPTGDTPLIATDGLLVLAGAPPVLPPIRPGTTAPSAVSGAAPSVAPSVAPNATSGATSGAITAPTANTPQLAVPVATEPNSTAPLLDATVEGLNVIAGAPPVLPPARPGTTAPSAASDQDAQLDALSTDITTALNTTAAQIPTANTARPLVRPETVTFAAAAAANVPEIAPTLISQAPALRPLTRPAGLAPVTSELATTEPDVDTAPEPIAVAAPIAPPVGLSIAPEIAAAVEASANRPNPIVNPTAQAVAQSERPDTRPRNMARIVARTQAAQQRAATQVAAVAPRTVSPNGPTAAPVAQNATLENAINLRDMNLIGIYGGSDDRRALVRLGSGRFLRLNVGDRLDGGRVTAISANALSYTKGGRALTLEVPG